MGSFKVILFLVLKLLGQINGQVFWNEDCIVLSDEASMKDVTYSPVGDAGFRLEIPELGRVGNNFDLGVFNFVGSEL